MKKTIKTIITLTIAAAMAFCIMSVSATASGMADIAVPISIGEEVSSKALGISSSANYYKIECGKGDLTIDYSADQRPTAVSLYDGNGKEIAYTKAEATDGKVRNLSFDSVTLTKKTYVYWSSKLKNAKGKITYKIEKAGLYYIQIGGLGSSYTGTFTFTVDANATANPSNTDNIKIEPIITMNIGDTIKIGGIVTPANGTKVKVSYRDNGVISVSSKGKVTALRSGESYVTISYEYLKIRIYIAVEA